MIKVYADGELIISFQNEAQLDDWLQKIDVMDYNSLHIEYPQEAYA